MFQYMLIVFAQLLTVDSRTVCRQTRNTKVTKDVETIVTTWTNDNHRVTTFHYEPTTNNNDVDGADDDDNNNSSSNNNNNNTCNLVAVVHNHVPPPLYEHHIHASLSPND